MLQLTNRTPFAANFTLLPNEAGIDTLFVNIKATFTIGAQLMLAPEQPAPQLEDIYSGEPARSSILLASDIHIGKVATDIIVNGDAIALDAQTVTQLQAGVAVGQTQKVIQVTGDRFWDGRQASAPLPFDAMPIAYERAYGGALWEGENCLDADPRNPVGTGYYSKKITPQNGDPLPNIEDPHALVQSPTSQATPSGLGVISPNWAPRMNYAGTYDAHWQTHRAPFLPTDFDKRFCNAAHPDLIYSGFLTGGEPIQIANMHPDGVIKTEVPLVNLRCKATIATRDIDAIPQLETLILMPNTQTMSLVWKAAIPAGKHSQHISDIVLSMHR